MLLMTNVDNLTCDQIPYIIKQLIEKGAGNVHVIPALTKKGRPEFIFLIDVAEDKFKNVAEFMAAEAGTLGLRIIEADHKAFNYEMQQVKVKLRDKEGSLLCNDNINVKIIIGEDGKPLSVRAEYKELKAAAESLKQRGSELSFYELKEIVEFEALKKIRKSMPEIEVQVVEQDAYNFNT